LRLCLGALAALGIFCLKDGALGFELCLVGIRCAQRLATAQKEVTGKAVLYLHDLAQGSELGDALKKNDFHGSILLITRREAEARKQALDGLGELALLLGGDRRDAAWHDLATLGNVTLQKAHILVIDLWCAFTGEGAAFPAPKEWAAGCLFHSH
jgi:hypothetical protein